ncbi:hypothetical protein [Alteromonas gracilis]|uniref:hypothetical protein n=1 Tax=Alteromonas gracilis TaxID=1479524 RepID=UPI0037355FF9
MISTDEKFSAFLDGEQEITEMDEVHKAIGNDVVISDRIVALVVSLTVLAALVFINQQGDKTTQPSHWASVSSVLDRNLAGAATTLNSGVTVTPQLSFFDSRLHYCRQAEVTSKDELNVMIACKDKQGAWQLTASKLNKRSEVSGQTAAAVSTNLMEDELDRMMAFAPLNREQEKKAIEATWLAERPKE